MTTLFERTFCHSDLLWHHQPTCVSPGPHLPLHLLWGPSAPPSQPAEGPHFTHKPSLHGCGACTLPHCQRSLVLTCGTIHTLSPGQEGGTACSQPPFRPLLPHQKLQSSLPSLPPWISFHPPINCPCHCRSWTVTQPFTAALQPKASLSSHPSSRLMPRHFSADCLVFPPSPTSSSLSVFLFSA